jgi:hypothetical protein
MKRGFILSLDAVVAVTLLLLLTVFIVGLSLSFYRPGIEYERLYYAGKDLLSVMEEAKIEDLREFPTIEYYISEGVIISDDMDKTLLELVGSLWASGNSTRQGYANNITQDVIDQIVPLRVGYEMLMDGDSVYANSNMTGSYISRFSTIVSGYEIGKPVSGFMASAFLTRITKNTSSYAYFGGYVGDGNITRILSLPDDAVVFNAYMELDAGSDFTLHVNGEWSGDYSPSLTNLSADNWTICSTIAQCSNFTSGNNTLDINFTGVEDDFIGGGYIRVDFNTSKAYTLLVIIENNTAIDRYWFPGIHGLVNLFSSFHIPGSLTSLEAYLHYRNNISVNGTGVPVFFNIGGVEVYRSDDTGEINVTLNNTFLNSSLNYTELGNRTIPIRFGTESFLITTGVGTSDTILITDVSLSMNNCDVDATCTGGICDASSPCHMRRLNVAKDVDKDFVDNVLNVSGNRAGLVAYHTDIQEAWTKGLSTDMNMLKSTIDLYSPMSWTCICCGINRASDILTSSEYKDVKIDNNTEWLYNTSYPSSSPPDINGSNWTSLEYNDSFWSNGTAILGFENTPYSPNVDTDIGDNGGDYYFRKHFDIHRKASVEYVDLYILSDDVLEVYLNGNLVYNDSSNDTAQYWNNVYDIFYDDFESYNDSVAWQVNGYDLNSSPGYWYIDDTGEEVFLMADQAGYPANSPTDVLVFRDMDSYGYAETVQNLSALSSFSNPVLSYWWRTGTNDFESGEYGDAWVWDGSLHEVGRHRYGSVYQNSEVDLSGYNFISNFTVRFGSRSGLDDERFYLDDVMIRENSTRINASYLFTGDNVIAVKLKNDDSDSAKFDLKLEVRLSRYESMLVMSDGDANRECSRQNTGSATQDAIEAACDARESGIEVYSVAFGEDADITTLERIACWDCDAGDWLPGEGAGSCSRYYQSNDADELKDIYKEIADKVANASFIGQTINVTGNIALDNILYTDSYVEFNYTPIEPLSYGEIVLTFESDPFGGNISSPKNFTFPVFNEKIIDARVTSYSSEYWTDRLFVNSPATGGVWQVVYNLSQYGNEYFDLGDPYIVQIPVDLISPGQNNLISMDTGMSPLVTMGASPDNRVIYSISTRADVGYGNVFQLLDDAKQDAIQRLQALLDKFNITLLESDVTLQNIEEVPSLWGPAILEIRVWNK